MAVIFNWDPNWTQDVTIGATLNSGAADQTAEYTLDGTLQREFSIEGTYAAGTYDQAAFARVLRKVQSGGYQDYANAYMTVPLNGGNGISFSVNFTVTADINDFLIDVRNDSNLQITGLAVYNKSGSVP